VCSLDAAICLGVETCSVIFFLFLEVTRFPDNRAFEICALVSEYDLWHAKFTNNFSSEILGYSIGFLVWNGNGYEKFCEIVDESQYEFIIIFGWIKGTHNI
jgi:hypothetical protein